MKPIGIPELVAFFYRPHGRITRREYLLGTAFVFCIQAAAFAFLLGRTNLDTALVLATMVFGLPLTVAALVLVTKRCHDLGLPGTFMLLLVIPVFGLAWLGALALFPGNAGPNAYGPPPRFMR